MIEAGAVLGALAAAGLMLARSRAELVGAFGALGLATVLLAGGDGSAARIDFSSSTVIGALAAGAVLLGLLAALFVRFSSAVAPLLLIAAPLRLPIEADERNPLVLGIAGAGGLGRLYPFYAVLAGAILALAWRIARGFRPAPLPRLLAVPLALLVALTAVSLLWSADRTEGVDQLIFFWLPFTAVVPVLAHTPFPPGSARALGVTLVAEATLFAALGIWQAITHDLLFFTVALERANDLSSLFRVTSAFQDPNHYGRFLVLGFAVLLTAMWTARVSARAAAPLVATLAAGLYFSYSQSSMVALAAVAILVAVVAGNRGVRRTIAALSIVLALAGVAVVVVALAGGTAESVTSDRSTLVQDTGTVFLAHPVAGVGVGAQPLVTRDETEPGTAVIQNASHTTPLTVAAELGILGLTAYAALVLGAIGLLRKLARRRPPLALGLGAVLLGLLVHSLFYGGFFENPIAFGALGVAAAALPQRSGAVESPAARTGKPLEAMRS